MPPTSTSRCKVAIIVLTWNGKALTVDCVRSLLALDFPRVEIVVVDNASSDGTVEALKSSFGDRISLISNDENVGFSRGNNVGIRWALEHGADWVLLLNNDTVVDPHLVTELLAGARAFPRAGVLGPKIYYAEPPDQIWFAGGEVSLVRGIARHIGIRERDRGQYDRVRHVDYITGCALLARRDVFEKIGDLDPSYVAYFEDTDFCMRARRSGFDVIYVPGGNVWHRISSSTGGQLSRRKITRKFMSSIRFLRRYAAWYHWLTIPLFFTFDVIRIIILVSIGRIRNTPGNEPTSTDHASR